MRNIKLKIQYDGTDYHGWQIQKNDITVQETVKKAVQKIVKAFIGEHDFIGFASSGFSVKTTVREIYLLDVDKNGDIITIDVVGNGFLYNMVRIIAGTLVFVGGGKINPNDMADIINSKDRERAGITAPPQGLCLKEVYY